VLDGMARHLGGTGSKRWQRCGRLSASDERRASRWQVAQRRVLSCGTTGEADGSGSVLQWKPGGIVKKVATGASSSRCQRRGVAGNHAGGRARPEQGSSEEGIWGKQAAQVVGPAR
jgi:hypothetical protein